MENTLEWLAPLVFFILYAISQFIGKKNADEGEAPSTTSSQDEEAEARRIREEIRRRIEERQAQQDGAPVSPPPPPAPARQPQAQKSPAPSQPAGSFGRTISAPAPEAARGPTATERLEHEMARLERSRQEKDRVAEQVRRKMSRREKQSQALAAKAETARLRAVGRFNIRRDFGSPQDARRAFIYSEIFGMPVGLRSSRTQRHLWES